MRLVPVIKAHLLHRRRDKRHASWRPRPSHALVSSVQSRRSAAAHLRRRRRSTAQRARGSTSIRHQAGKCAITPLDFGASLISSGIVASWSICPTTCPSQAATPAPRRVSRAAWSSRRGLGAERRAAEMTESAARGSTGSTTSSGHAVLRQTRRAAVNKVAEDLEVDRPAPSKSGGRDNAASRRRLLQDAPALLRERARRRQAPQHHLRHRPRRPPQGRRAGRRGPRGGNRARRATRDTPKPCRL